MQKTTTSKVTSAKELMSISAKLEKKYFFIPNGKNLSVAINAVSAEDVLPRMVTYKCTDGTLIRVNCALKVKNTANASKTGMLHFSKVAIAQILQDIDSTGGAKDVADLRNAIVAKATSVLTTWATNGGSIGLSETVSEEGKVYSAALFVGNTPTDISPLAKYNVNSTLDINSYSNENMVSVELDFVSLLGGEQIVDQDLLAWWDKSCILDESLVAAAGARAQA